MPQSRHFLHLGQMLVAEPEGVWPVGQRRGALRALILIGRDQLFTPTAEAADGMHRDGVIRREDPGIDQGVNVQDESGGVAAGNGHPRGQPDMVPLVPVQFRQAVYPGLAGPVGGAGVDHPGGGIADQPDRFPGRLVGQAQDDEIGRVEAGRLGLGVFAPVFGDFNELDVLAGLETV